MNIIIIIKEKKGINLFIVKTYVVIIDKKKTKININKSKIF
jgi:hypothetical protein